MSAAVFAFAFDASGAARLFDIGAEPPEAAFVWVHADAGEPDARGLLSEHLGLDPIVVDALLATDTRPRCEPRDAGVTLNMRGVNLNEGDEPEDMVALRAWAEPARLVTVRVRKLKAVVDAREALERGATAASPGDLLAMIALRLADRMAPFVNDLNETVDDLEDRALGDAGAGLRGELANLRRSAILMRRYMAPQRDALNRASLEEGAWIDPRGRARMREAADAAARIAEELEAVRERAAVVGDHVVDMRAEAMNRSMLVLSVVAAIFLPLSLISGMLGMNVGGVPFAASPWGFWVVTALVVALGAAGAWAFKRLKML